MLNQIVVDMSTQLLEAKRQVAASIADEKRLAKQTEQEASNAKEWERRAMMAVRAGISWPRACGTPRRAVQSLESSTTSGVPTR